MLNIAEARLQYMNRAQITLLEVISALEGGSWNISYNKSTIKRGVLSFYYTA